jgi:hypothetical protein
VKVSTYKVVVFLIVGLEILMIPVLFHLLNLLDIVKRGVMLLGGRER